ncbi:hypothetical protein [Paenibacillus sp. sgz500958]|uniref:hypothetical protein n=1 Tax=Paenibacillus sp. sgz500958 TaxID=3242475 RepID=UPI0036D34752
MPNFDIEGETIMKEYSKKSGETKSYGAPVLDHWGSRIALMDADLQTDPVCGQRNE